MKAIVLLMMLGLVACGGAEDAEKAESEAAPFDDLTGTLDKAEAVEQQVMEQKERMDRALEEAEQPPE